MHARAWCPRCRSHRGRRHKQSTKDAPAATTSAAKETRPSASLAIQISGTMRTNAQTIGRTAANCTGGWLVASPAAPRATPGGILEKDNFCPCCALSFTATRSTTLQDTAAATDTLGPTPRGSPPGGPRPRRRPAGRPGGPRPRRRPAGRPGGPRPRRQPAGRPAGPRPRRGSQPGSRSPRRRPRDQPDGPARRPPRRPSSTTGTSTRTSCQS